MKKRILIATAMMLVLSVGVAMGVKKANMNQNPWADNIEALCSSEDPRCISGGPGATSCSIDAGVAPLPAASMPVSPVSALAAASVAVAAMPAAVPWVASASKLFPKKILTFKKLKS